MNLVVLGAGAWGTALAMQACGRHDVSLWARDPAQRERMHRTLTNAKYLPGVALPSSLRWPDDIRAAQGADLVVVATPMQGLRQTLGLLAKETPVVWLCKGFEQGSGLLGHEVAAQVAPGLLGGVLSGPSFAQEVALNQPTALVVASLHDSVCERAKEAFHGPSLRIYTSPDPVGVEVGGAVKNVLAIATGLCDGLAEATGSSRGPGIGVPGLNARAALITRGLAEMTRLGVALGAKPATFMGLSGLGDLVLTATGALSRNRRVGLALATGQRLPQVLADLGHVAEGVHTAPVVWARAQSLGVEMPITEAVVQVLRGELTPEQGVARLMSREPRAEGLA